MHAETPLGSSTRLINVTMMSAKLCFVAKEAMLFAFDVSVLSTVGERCPSIRSRTELRLTFEGSSLLTCRLWRRLRTVVEIDHKVLKQYCCLISMLGAHFVKPLIKRHRRS